MDRERTREMPKGGTIFNGGARVEVLPRTTYTLSGAASSEQNIELAKYVDTLAWVSGVLVVRVHSMGTFTTNVTADVVVQNTSYSDEEPQTVFADTTSETVARIAYTTTAPTLLITPLDTPIAAQVRVLLRLTEPASPGPATFTISVELVGRDA